VINYDLSIVIPTYNEAENISLIVDAIRKVLNKKVSYEIIIVDDDSQDKTWKIAEEYTAKYDHVTCFRRISKKGLSSAVIDGFMLANGKYVGVIDADLQHDESILLSMLAQCNKGADLVIGSRYCEEGSTGSWDTSRKLISKVATKMSQYITTAYTTDPMSGFFIIKKSLFLTVVDKLHVKGYKILLDIVSQLDDKNIKIKEVPYTFKNRIHGESKLSPEVVMQLIDFIYLKAAGTLIPIDYIKFISVGAIGAIMHFSVLYIAYVFFSNSYQISLIIAIEATLIINYFINNFWTFRKKTHKGFELFYGLLKFNVLSGIGGIISYYLSISLFSAGTNWILASIIGAIVASLWNYNLNKILTWNAR
jgi:dolichol-phosphate mannosyltransferase